MLKDEGRTYEISLNRQKYRNEIFGVNVLESEKREFDRGEWIDERRARQSTKYEKRLKEKENYIKFCLLDDLFII